jgi:hypothetical protein
LRRKRKKERPPYHPILDSPLTTHSPCNTQDWLYNFEDPLASKKKWPVECIYNI